MGSENADVPDVSSTENTEPSSSSSETAPETASTSSSTNTSTSTPPPVTSPPPQPSSPPPSEQSPPPPDQSPPPPDQSPPPPDSSPPPPDEETPTPPPPESGSGSQSPPPSPSTTQKSPPPSPYKTPNYAPPPPPGSRPPPAKALPKSNSPSKDSGESKSSASSTSHVVIVGAAIGGFVILAMVLVCLACCGRKKKKKKHYYMDPPPPAKGGEYYGGAPNWNNNPPGEYVVKVPPPPGPTQQRGLVPWGGPIPGPASGEQSSVFSGTHPIVPPTANASPGFIPNQSDFTYEELAAATGGFSQANLLGQGGFGYVHMGILPSGKEVAVKSLKIGSGQGEREFQAEVEIISRVHHRHLVSLVGYCIADGQRMLVYEFVPNKTLEFHLHGKGRPTMEWANRLRIALGSAKGLAYLHEDCHPRIIHRDIKAANILLDYNNEAMVADFGLAKLSSDNYTHVSTRVMGTFGYLAPEYASTGKLTEKSDVFSFGVMLLELITGRQPVDLTNQYMEDSLVDWARPLLSKALEDGNFDELVDPRLEYRYDPQEMARVISCAAASIRHSARRRPRMSKIVRALEGESSLEDLNDAVKPGIRSATPETSVYDTGAYNADMLKFRKMILNDSSEMGSSADSRELADQKL